MVGADEFFNVDKTVAAGIAPAAAVADGDDVITFGDGTEVYGDAFCGVGVGGGIHVVAAVQGVAAGTAVEHVIAVVALQCVVAAAAFQRVVVIVAGKVSL